jgi:DNA polymerase/3'-5' exonuclease PolX
MNTKKHTKKHNNTNTLITNQTIINILDTVKNYYSRLKNTIHVNAYERAIYQIRKWQKPITVGKELSHLEGIGKGMIAKIDTIIKTGTLPIIKEQHLEVQVTKTKKLTKQSKYNIQEEIKNILGFGEKIASQIKTKYGIETISQLRELVSQNKIQLTPAQQIGLKYHTDLQFKIPRAEITKIGSVIKTILADDNVFVFLAGSYPSGLKSESKDIDILIASRRSLRTNIKQTGLVDIISKLKSNNILSLETVSLGTTKFLGIVKIKGNDKQNNINKNIWHHLDIRFVDMQAFPYAWLYYSSGKIFNKLIREKLKKHKDKAEHKYKLNEWGLFQDNKKMILENELDNNDLVKQIQNEKQLMQYTEKIEKEIFKIANLEYKTVSERY